MNAHIQTALAGNKTGREDEITTKPLDFDEVPMFNPAGGYGSFVLPAVLMLIIQQTLLLGIGMAAGTARENNRYKDLVPISRHYQGIFRIVFGKSMCYFMIYIVLAAYLALVVPRLFSFVYIGSPGTLFAVLLPYLLACIFFGLTLSCMIRYRENVMLRGVLVRATAVSQRSVVATEQHPRRVADGGMALSIHVWRESLREGKLHEPLSTTCLWSTVRCGYRPWPISCWRAPSTATDTARTQPRTRTPRLHEAQT